MQGGEFSNAHCVDATFTDLHIRPSLSVNIYKNTTTGLWQCNIFSDYIYNTPPQEGVAGVGPSYIFESSAQK